MKAIKYANGHTDIFTYNVTYRTWIRIRCSLDGDMICTAPRTYPRGAKFDYNVNPTPELRIAEDSALEVYAEMRETLCP